MVSELPERTEKIQSDLNQHLLHLRDAESERANAAVVQLQTLQNVVKQHLQQLGAELQTPIASLIKTASATPQAVTELMTEWRHVLSTSVQRDNELVNDTQATLQQLQATMQHLEHSARQQADNVQTFMQTSATQLQALHEQFSQQLQQDTERLHEGADTITAGTIDLMSLNDGFAAAVAQFSESNQQVTATFERIEHALQTGMTRSDEQMMYYVAQAREIIDQNLLSQQALIEQLRTTPSHPTVEVMD